MPDATGSDDPTRNPDGNPPPPPVEPAIEQRMVALESNSHTHAAQEDSTKEMKREFRLVEFFTIATNVILAIVGIFALRAYYGQLGAMQGQLREMKHTNELTQKALNQGDITLQKTLEKLQGQTDATNRLYVEAQKQTTNSGIQATASTNGAGAAKSAADTAKSALVNGQRAFLFPTTTIHHKAGIDGKTIGFGINILWENSGSTPTRLLSTHANRNRVPLFELTSDMHDYHDVWGRTDDRTPQYTFLGPKATTFGAEESFIPIETAYSMADENTSFWYWGWVKYNDIFENTPRHLVEYCFRATASRGGTEGVGLYFLNCPTHNCADKECPDYEERIKEK